MRFHLDEDLSDEVARICRGLNVDVISSHESGHDGLDDLAQLEFAATEVRCLVSCNRTDFLNLTTMFYERESPHAGVLIVTSALRAGGPAAMAAAIAEYDRRHPDGIFPYTFDYLSGKSSTPAIARSHASKT